MKRYETIVFMQNDEAREPLDILKASGEDEAIDFLLQWDYGDSGMWDDIEPYGTASTLYRRDDLVLSYNTGLDHIGLTREHMEE